MKKVIIYLAIQVMVLTLLNKISYSVNEPYRSNASGNWNSNSTWEYSTNGGATFSAAPFPPSNTSGTITIRSPHIVTVSSNETADQLVISTGSQISISLGMKLTIFNGSTQDLKLESGSFLNGPGILSAKGNTVDLIISNSADFNAPLSVDSGTATAGDIGSPFTAKFNGTVTLNSGTVFTPLGSHTIQANNNVINNGTILQSSNATFTMKGPSFSNNGIVNITFRLDSTTTLSGTGVYSNTTITTLGANSIVTLANDVIFNNHFTISTGGILNPNNKIFTYTSGIFTLNTGATFSSPGTMKTQGIPRITVQNGSSFNADLRVISGTIEVSQSTSPFIPVFNGMITVDSGAAFTNTGGSSPRANGNVLNNGTMSPFNSNFKFAGLSFINNGNITYPIEILSGSHTLSGTGFINNLTTLLSGASLTLTSNHKMNSININSGGTFVITGFRFSVTASNPITNSGTFATANSTIEYNGTSSQNISFTNVPYKNLLINNPANVVLTGNIEVNDTLSVVNGDLILFGNIITLSPVGFLKETPGNTVVGFGLGYITTTRVLNAPSSLNIAGLGSTLTTLQNLDTVEIRRGHIQNTGLNSNVSILRHYDIIPKNNSLLNATLVFKYDDSELNNHNEGSLSLFRSTNSGSTWTLRGGTINTSLNTLTLSGIDSFSRWSVGRGAVNSQIKLIPEGLYNSGLNKLNLRDTLRIYIRNNFSPFAIIDSSKSVIDSNTFTGNFLFLNTPGGTYYLMATHRNSIETWSKASGEVYTIGSGLNFDFTISDAQAFGNNMILKGSKWCIYGGDANRDGVVDGNDTQLIDNDAANFETGYRQGDINGDGIVDGSDALIAGNNADGFVSKITP